MTPWREQRIEQLEVERRRSLLQEDAGGVHLDVVTHPAEEGGHGATGSPADDVPQRQLDGAAGVGGDPSLTEPPPGVQTQPLGKRLDGARRLPNQQRREHLLDDPTDHGRV